MVLTWEIERVFWSPQVPKYCFPWALSLVSTLVDEEPVVVVVFVVVVEVVDVLLVAVDVLLVVVVEPARH